MTREQIDAIVARQLVAEARYLGARDGKPVIRAERRRILEQAERELAAVVANLFGEPRAQASGSPAPPSGNPDAIESETA